MPRRLTRRGALMLGVHPAFEQSALECLGRTDTEIRAALGERPGLIDRAADAARLLADGQRPAAPGDVMSALACVPQGAVSAEFEQGYVLADGLACIRIEGCLTPDGYYDWWSESWTPGYAQIQAGMRAAQADERVSGVFLMIDSPGGLTSGAWPLADYMRGVRGAAGGKPVIAWVRMAASAAQLIAAQADACFAEDGADLGSIGVKASWLDYSAYLEKEGIADRTFVSGRLKDIYSRTRPPTEEEQALIQADVDDHARRFFDHVAAGRGLDAETVRSWEARLFGAGSSGDADAAAAGLIDGVLGQEQAFIAARVLAGLGSDENGQEAGMSRAASLSGAARRGDRKAAATEMTMTELEKRLAALKGRAATGDAKARTELNQLKALLAEGEDDQTDAEGEDDEMAEGEGDQTEAEGEDEEQAEGEDDETDAEGEDEDGKEALAGQILSAAAKQGKPKFGQRLAIQVASGRRGYKAALSDLKAAARETNPLKDAMTDGRGGAAPSAETRPAPAAGLAAALDKRVGRKPEARAS